MIARGWYAERGVVIGQVFFGKLDRASGLRRNSLWIDPERKLALVLLTNRTRPDRAIKAIQEVLPAFTICLQMEWRRDAVAARRIKES
jgi:hypothetical protein